MQNSINQFYLLCIFIASGSIIGIFFDFFRILRKTFKTQDLITYIQDIIFWIFTGIFLFYIIFHFCLGEIRLYMFISLGIGLIIYFLTISKYVIMLNVKLFTFMKKIVIKIYKIILFPFNLIFKIIKNLFNPITFITIKISKYFTFLIEKIVKKINILNKNKKNIKEKKDFTA